jgi:hypothetical protein
VVQFSLCRDARLGSDSKDFPVDDRGMVVGIIDARMRWMSGSIWGKRGKEGGSVIWKDPSAL